MRENERERKKMRERERREKKYPNIGINCITLYFRVSNDLICYVQLLKLYFIALYVLKYFLRLIKGYQSDTLRHVSITYPHTYTRAYIHTYIHTYTHTFIYTHIYTQIKSCINYMHMNINTPSFAHANLIDNTTHMY